MQTPSIFELAISIMSIICVATCGIDVRSLLLRGMLLQYRDTLTNQCKEFCKSIHFSITLQDDAKQMDEWLYVLSQTELALGRELQHLPGDICHMEIFRVIDTMQHLPDASARLMKRVFGDQHVATRLALLPTDELELPDDELQTHLFARLHENVKHFIVFVWGGGDVGSWD